MDREEPVGSTLKNAARSAASSAERISDRVGETVGSIGDNVRQGIPGSGKVGDAVEAATRSIKRTADYVQEEGMSGIVEDLELLIRRYPLQTLLLGMGCGYLLSRLRSD